MTTIAFDGKTLAADTLVSCGPQQGVLLHPARKIRVLPNGDIVGVAGSLHLVEAVLLWLERSAGDLTLAPQIFPGQSWQVLEITRHGMFLRTSAEPQRCGCVAPAAIGSGGAIALGAMLAEKTAAEAVAIAALVDSQTGGEIDIIDISGKGWPITRAGGESA